jgi:hypothetical protein
MTTSTATTGSAIVAALENTWAAIQERVADVPDVLFITGTGLMGRGAKWGHYRHHGWATRAAACPAGCEEHAHDGALVRLHADGRKPEVFIAGERLACGAEDTLQTMLHEAAHALNAARGEKGTSKEGRYHNRVFVAAAEALGLTFPADQSPDATIGYSAVVLTAEARATYADALLELDRAIAVYMDTFAGRRAAAGGANGGEGVSVTGGPGGEAKPKSRNNPRAVCGCETPRLIRASRKVLAEAPILCGACRQEFRVHPDDEE